MLYENSILRLKEILDNLDGKIALAFSHQTEDVVAIDLALKTGIKDLEIFTLDTKKLFKESLEYQKQIEKFFGVEIKIYAAPSEILRKVDEKIGLWGMRESIENRKFCCHERKMVPLKTALSGKTAWISGIRAAQSVTRAGVLLLEDDANFNLKKINPVFDWSDEDLQIYAQINEIPLNPLYEQGFLSIGCQSCTRAVKPGEDIRAGRWWWEDPAHKECGLHIKN